MVGRPGVFATSAGTGVAVLAGVAEGTGVEVRVGVAVGAGVAVPVGVTVGRGVAVAVGIAMGVAVGIAVGTGLTVGATGDTAFTVADVSTVDPGAMAATDSMEATGSTDSTEVTGEGAATGDGAGAQAPAAIMQTRHNKQRRRVALELLTDDSCQPEILNDIIERQSGGVKADLTRVF
jgi:hypothetical protein